MAYDTYIDNLVVTGAEAGATSVTAGIYSEKTRGVVRAVKNSSTSTSTAFVLTAEGITEYYDGLMVIFKNDATASASGITINLNGIGAKSVWNSDRNSAIATGIRANGEYILIFDYANNRWVMYVGYYDTNSNTIGEYAGPTIAGNGNMARYSLIMQTQLDPPRFASLVTTSTTSTNKIKQSCGFIPNGVVFYQSAGTYADGESAGRTGVWCIISGIDARYSTNVSSTTLPADTSGKAFYIKGTITGGLFYLADTWWAVDLPTTADGYYYIYVGQMYSRYQFSLFPNHPIYYHDGTSIKEYTMDANVTQTNTTASGNYRLLLSGTATGNTETTTVNKTSTLYYDPSTKQLFCGTFSSQFADGNFQTGIV